MTTSTRTAAESAAVFSATFAAADLATLNTNLANVTTSEVLPALPALAPVLAWTTKAGKEKAAFTATGARFAPQANQTSAARQSDLTSWKNGRFEGLVKDAKAILSNRQILTIADTINLCARSKVDALALFRAIVGEFPAPGMDKAPKGVKAAMLATLQAVIDIEEELASLKALKITEQKELTN
jgi:hypothetical protein